MDIMLQNTLMAELKEERADYKEWLLRAMDEMRQTSEWTIRTENKINQTREWAWRAEGFGNNRFTEQRRRWWVVGIKAMKNIPGQTCCLHANWSDTNKIYSWLNCTHCMQVEGHDHSFPLSFSLSLIHTIQVEFILSQTTTSPKRIHYRRQMSPLSISHIQLMKVNNFLTNDS